MPIIRECTYIYMTCMTQLIRLTVKSELLDLTYILYVDFLWFGKCAEKIFVYAQKIFWEVKNFLGSRILGSSAFSTSGVGVGVCESFCVCVVSLYVFLSVFCLCMGACVQQIISSSQNLRISDIRPKPTITDQNRQNRPKPTKTD